MTRKIEEGQSYIFKYESSGLTSRSNASNSFKGKYTKWVQISGKQVVVVSKETGLHGFSYLVYVKQDGPDFYFRSVCDYLFQCTCDLTLLMNRGCQCGFFSIEQSASK